MVNTEWKMLQNYDALNSWQKNIPLNVDAILNKDEIISSQI